MRVEEIMKQVNDLPGMEEFKDLCRRLRVAADNVNAYQLGRTPLPNLIFAAAPGCGITLHIRLLAELLKALKLLRFTGEEEYFEWALSNEEKAFGRFLLRVKKAGGFYGQFHGVIGLDISDMLQEGEPLPEMERLMEYVDARQGKIVFVFIVPDTASERTISQLLGWFASSTPAELVRMPFPKEEAQHYVSQHLERSGYAVTAEASELLREAVLKLCGNEAFEGYQTLINLADEIVWRKISRAVMTSTEITREDVAFVCSEDGYFSRLNAYSHRTNRRKVGFGAAMEG